MQMKFWGLVGWHQDENQLHYVPVCNWFVFKCGMSTMSCIFLGNQTLLKWKIGLVCALDLLVLLFTNDTMLLVCIEIQSEHRKHFIFLSLCFSQGYLGILLLQLLVVLDFKQN